MQEQTSLMSRSPTTMSIFKTKEMIMQEHNMGDREMNDYIKTVTNCLFKLRVAYPAQSRNYNEVEANALTSLWLEAFAGMDSGLLVKAVDSYIKYDNSGFFPSPGQIRDFADRMPREKQKWQT